MANNISSSRFHSSEEVEECIRNAGPVFHVLSPGGHMPPEIVSPYDNGKRGSGNLEGFALRPPTIFDKPGDMSFSTKVYLEWIKRSTVPYNGIALPGMTYVEATGTFRLESLGPGPYPGQFFLDELGLSRALASLAAVALREAVKQHLTEGGDERLHLSPQTGGNKYFCPPHPVPNMITRGSCTCSPPSQHAFDAACRLLNDIWNCDVSFDEACDDVRVRISTALGIETPHHVILHPSGTDSEYTPLLIGANKAKALGCTGIVNLVVGAGEVGSNTPQAAGGRHFSKYMPTGGTDSTASLLDDFPEGASVLQLRARRPDGSLVPCFDESVLSEIREASKSMERPFFIMHAVDGSKLGSHITTRELVRKVQAEHGDRVLVVLDACQARTEREELDWYLSHGAVILITASKFYGAPGFCAAALVPDSVSSQLKDGAVVPVGLGDYLTQSEVPDTLAAFRAGLPSEPKNIGLLLRWTCGVAEMERLAQVGPDALDAIHRWVLAVGELIGQRDPYLELLSVKGEEQPSQLGGVNSILSFKLLVEDEWRPLETAPLRKIHQWLTADVSALLPGDATEAERRTASLKCFIGQPVDLGDFAILRMAMGAGLASDLGSEKRTLETVLEEDSRVLDKIVLLLRYHKKMSCGSGN